MSDHGPLPPASGLARSLRRLFDGNGAPAGDAPSGPRNAGVAAPSGNGEAAPHVVLRERFTNRLARYLRGDSAERARLREAIRDDIALFLEASEPGPLADAVLALSAASGGRDPARSLRGGVEAVDPLLPALLTPEVLAEIEAREKAGRERGGGGEDRPSASSTVS